MDFLGELRISYYTKLKNESPKIWIDSTEQLKIP